MEQDAGDCVPSRVDVAVELEHNGGPQEWEQ